MVLKHDSWTDKSVDFIISDIVEYDMKRGGLNIIKEKNLLDDETISKLSEMDKHDADTKIGKLQIKNKSLRDGLKDGFQEYRLKFGEANELTDSDILSVKKDAIFVKRYCYETKFDNYIEFREKNVYQAFMKIPNSNIELYWNYDKLDIKGIRDELIPKMKEICNFLSMYIKYLCQYDIDGARKFIVKTIDDYKFRRLPINFYREFNSEANFKMIINDQIVSVNDVGEPYKNDILIEYNFLNVLVPLLDFVMI